MEACLDQQKKSTFVNVLAWTFIVLAGFSTLISILQNIMISVLIPIDEMNMAFESAPAREQIPFFARFMFSNIRFFFLSFLIISGTTFVSAIGLLKRKNWGRIIFMSIMGLGICWNIFSLVLQNLMFASFPDFPHGEMSSEFNSMMNVMKVFTFIFAVGISYLFGWIIYQLSSLKIKNEFAPPAISEQDDVTIDKDPFNQKRRNFILVGSVVLTIAVGGFYFGSGGMKSDTNSIDIQGVAISGDAAQLSRMLTKNPQLANTIGKSDNWTPLHGAACNSNIECVRLLIDAGADVNVQSCNQRTALHCSAEDGNVEIVALLLKANANPNLKDSMGKTPLDYAIWNNHLEIIKLLRNHDGQTSTDLDEKTGHKI
jgi:hypothetical protein